MKFSFQSYKFLFLRLFVSTLYHFLMLATIIQNLKITIFFLLLKNYLSVYDL
ncbi:hypothetical protein BRYFOR_05985 [Marvinbryantia formatexigens DSM 14469]|uniref:Uncharacterized protein n=1 Tax=Marvinbryantia formatexigens DSM 14469 TaxID=478749 RepID=C6LBJ0_9FIRM|nr:hypothetical protein BRYFOR_05985 [Marvinbryantia formatexigens DSM 14469]